MLQGIVKATARKALMRKLKTICNKRVTQRVTLYHQMLHYIYVAEKNNSKKDVQNIFYIPKMKKQFLKIL